MEVTTNQLAVSRRPAYNWRTAGIVAALCVVTAFMLETIASELVSQEVITVIAVAAVFFLLLGFSAARSRARGAWRAAMGKRNRPRGVRGAIVEGQGGRLPPARDLAPGR